MRVPVIVGSGVVAVAAAGAVWMWMVMRPAPPATDEARAVAPTVTAPAPPAVASAPAPAAPAPVTPRGAPARTPAPGPEPAAPVVAAPTTGTLHVESDVPDSLVLFNRVGVGDAPVTIRDIAPGRYQLNVSARGYDGYSETIEVEPGERTIRVSFKEIRLDARLEAVHKHGMGSCRGILTATPQGVQFTAADGKDNFSVAFAHLDTFEVDYLAKNLRIRVRQGRTYNFGDPDDNADRLFVFHRDVDKVRERVLSGQ